MRLPGFCGVKDPFRTLEITEPTEVHIKNYQLELTQYGKEPVYIPIEDLATITVIGPILKTPYFNDPTLCQIRYAIVGFVYSVH